MLDAPRLAGSPGLGGSRVSHSCKDDILLVVKRILMTTVFSSTLCRIWHKARGIARKQKDMQVITTGSEEDKSSLAKGVLKNW